MIVPRGETVKAVERLPISLLRLSERTIDDLRMLGFRTIGELSATPRAPLILRFGPDIARRLDQLFGRVGEPIDPIRRPELIEVNRNQEPIGAAETIDKYVGRLVIDLCNHLQKRAWAFVVSISSFTRSTTRPRRCGQGPQRPPATSPG